MPSSNQDAMARSRGLITFTERQRISGQDEVEDSKRYQAVSRVRRRIQEELPKEIDILANNHPELLEELRAVICKNRGENIPHEEMHYTLAMLDEAEIRVKLESGDEIPLVVQHNSISNNQLSVDATHTGDTSKHFRLEDEGPNTPVFLTEILSPDGERNPIGEVHQVYIDSYESSTPQ